MTDIEYIADRVVERAATTPPTMSWVRQRARQRRRRRRTALWTTMGLPLLIMGGVVATNLADQDSSQKVIVRGPTEQTSPVTTLPESTSNSEPVLEEIFDAVTDTAAAFRVIDAQPLPAWYDLEGGGQLLFTEAGEASEVAQAYLRQRLMATVGDISDPVDLATQNEIVVQQEELADRTALYSYYSPSEPENDVEGFVHLILGDGQWHVSAATAKGIDLGDLETGSQGLNGTILSSSEYPFYVDVVDQQGEPLPAVAQPVFFLDNGEGVGGAGGSASGELDIAVNTRAAQVNVRVYLAGNSQLFGLTELSIPQRDLSSATYLEVYLDPVADLDAVAVALVANELVTDYRFLSESEAQRRFELAQRSGALDANNFDLERIEVALVALEQWANVDDVMSMLLRLPGSLGVDFYQPEDMAEREFDSSKLIVETVEVTEAPPAVQCQPPPGTQAPLNVIHTVEHLQAESTASEALSRFFADAEETPWPKGGYIEFVEPSGQITYGFTEFESNFIVIVRLENTDEGWRVVEWETPGC